MVAGAATIGALGPLTWLSARSIAAEQSRKAPMTQNKPANTLANGYIDAHVHVWTPDTVKYPLAAGYQRDEMKPPSFTPGELLAQARPCGVSRVVLVQMSFYGFDNSYMLDSMKAYPGVFSGIAVIDDGSTSGARENSGKAAKPADEMQRLKALGVRGFRIFPRNLPPDRWLGSPQMASMWECGAAERLAMCCLVNPDALPEIDRMCGKYPGTPVVIDHFARIGVDGQIHEADLKKLCGLARHKNTMVKISAFYALGKKQAPYTDLGPMVQRLLDAFGRERLMWATDCPYQVQDKHTYCDSVKLIEERLEFLTADDRQWLLRKTAEKMFFT